MKVAVVTDPYSPRDDRQRDTGAVHAIGVTFGSVAKGGATKWTWYDQEHWHSADHILRQLLYRDHPHDVHRLQSGPEESGLGHDHGLSDQPAAVRRDAGQGHLSRHRHFRRRCRHGRHRSKSGRRARADDPCDHALGGALRLRFAARPHAAILHVRAVGLYRGLDRLSERACTGHGVRHRGVARRGDHARRRLRRHRSRRHLSEKRVLRLCAEVERHDCGHAALACRWLDPASDPGSRDGTAPDRSRCHRTLFARHELALRHRGASPGSRRRSRFRPQDRDVVAVGERHRGSPDAASAPGAARCGADAPAGRNRRLDEAGRAARPTARGRIEARLRRDHADGQPAITLGGPREGQSRRSIDRAHRRLAGHSRFYRISRRPSAGADRRSPCSSRADRAQTDAHGSGHRAVNGIGGRRRDEHMCVLLDRDRLAGRRRGRCLLPPWLALCLRPWTTRRRPFATSRCYWRCAFRS